MIFTKDTVIVKVEAIAKGYYSNAVAYGKIFLPEDLFSKYTSIDSVEDLEFGVHELDGKHSYTQGEYSVTTGSIEQFVNEIDEYENSQQDTLLESFAELLKTGWSDLKNFNETIDNLSKQETKTVTLSQPTLVEQAMLPKGTKLTYTSVSTDNLEEFEEKIEFTHYEN